MSKTDLKKELKSLYSPSAKEPVLVDVPPMSERLHAFLRAEGYELAGKHHEVYLSDPRRTAPEKLKTVLRQPVRPARPADKGAAAR